MKNRMVTAAVMAVYGLLIAVGPQTIFKVCENSTTPMRCTYSASAEIGIGLLGVLLGVLMWFTRTRREGALLCVAGMGLATLAGAVPLVLIGGCKNPKMPCVMLSFPIIYLLTGLVLLYLAVTLFLQLRKKDRKAGEAPCKG